jgi:hypothetical protein
MQKIRAIRMFSLMVLVGLTTCAQPPRPTRTVPELCQFLGFIVGTPQFKSCLIREGRDVAAIETEIVLGDASARMIAQQLHDDIERRQGFENLPIDVGDRFGTVLIRIRVDPNGTLRTDNVTRSSRNRLIDQIGLQILALYSPYAPTLSATSLYFDVQFEFVRRTPSKSDRRQWSARIMRVKQVLIIRS